MGWHVMRVQPSLQKVQSWLQCVQPWLQCVQAVQVQPPVQAVQVQPAVQAVQVQPPVQAVHCVQAVQAVQVQPPVQWVHVHPPLQWVHPSVQRVQPSEQGPQWVGMPLQTTACGKTLIIRSLTLNEAMLSSKPSGPTRFSPENSSTCLRYHPRRHVGQSPLLE